MPKILLIKLGALGDVLRTTPLLRRLRGSVTWATGRAALPLLAGNPRIARLCAPAEFGKISRERFDWVINFDEDRQACALAARVQAARKTGARLDRGEFTYCEASAPWFDMSLISRLGLRAADKLKYRARKPYQHYLFKACGFSFRGEEYLLPAAFPRPARKLVAVEKRSGSKWPLKRWPGYDALIRLFERNGIDFIILRQRKDLRDYIADISRCAVLVSGDTLAMHLALALRKRAVAVFNCTSPWEIYDYKRLRKLVHPALSDNFYSTRAGGLSAIKTEAMYKAAAKALRNA